MTGEVEINLVRLIKYLGCALHRICLFYIFLDTPVVFFVNHMGRHRRGANTRQQKAQRIILKSELVVSVDNLALW